MAVAAKRFITRDDVETQVFDDGLTLDELAGDGASARTLRTFIKSYHDLIGAIRDIVLPDPDVRPG